MPKVAHFIDSDDPGGAETLVIDLAKALNGRDYISVVFLFDNPWLKRYCDKNDISWFKVPYERLYRSKYTLPLFALLFAWFVKRHSINILHSHLFDTVLPGCIAARLLGISHIATLHDKYSIENSSFRLAILKLATKLGSLLVPVSRDISSLLHDRGKISSPHMYTIYNGVEMDKYDGKNCSNKDLGIGPRNEDFIFICVARLIKLKCHDVLINAFGKLIKNYHSVKLLLVGDGPLRDAYQIYVDEQGLSNSVYFLGQRDDIPDLLNASDCFVMVSTTEGLSCSIIEAMAAGLPVITTRVGGNPELVNEEENGYLIKVNDVNGLYVKMAEMVGDRKRARTMGRASRSRAEAEFSIQVMAQKYINLYKR